MASILYKRPRDVNAYQAASILYGDWGTSKAYVIGLAFALATYSSFWLVAFLSIMNVLVGINYIIICRSFPNGGGAYTSVHKRSEVIALIAAFFLIADYLVTASLSAVSGFNYLGVAHPAIWAMASILIIGMLNYFGPRHTGNIALIIGLLTFLVVFILGMLSIPFLGEAIKHTTPLQGSLEENWIHFTSIVVGMSGIEAIANTTGVMKLDANTKPYSVTKTSTPAIITVMLEVSILTTLFSLAVNALPELTVINGEVNAPGNQNVRDYMLRYMGEEFAGALLGEAVGHFFSFIISIVFCILLLSAVNTAIIALVSLLFVMSRKQDVPTQLQRLNRFGVPLVPLVFATLIPIGLVAFYLDVAHLADLYAVGFVGAIATNLAATSTDKTLNLSKVERIFMFATFMIMAAIELTLLIQKPHARNFALVIMTIGLLLRSLVLEQKVKKVKSHPKERKDVDVITTDQLKADSEPSLLCVTKEPNKALEFAIKESIRHKKNLYVLFLRQQQVITEEDHASTWQEDKDALQLYTYTNAYKNFTSIKFIYVISEAASPSIVKLANTLNVSQIIIQQKRTRKLHDFFRGNLIYQISRTLPQEVQLIVII